VLSEVILSTKELRKVRDAAYDLLVIMGNKMKAGGVVVMQGVVDADEIVEDGNIYIFIYMINSARHCTVPQFFIYFFWNI